MSVDISEVISAYTLTRSEVEGLASYMVESIASRFVKNVEMEARTKLHQSRKAYLQGISMRKIQYNAVEVTLTGILPNMVESGASAFDMKQGFMKSKKSVAKKGGGWYFTVPFEHATPGALAESSTFAEAMPEAVYAVAKGLADKKSLKTSDFKGTVPKEMTELGKRAPVANTSREFAEYQHKYNKYVGMTRNPVANHGGYTTFRRVSDTSDKAMFIHPGIEARNLFGAAGENMNLIHSADMARDSYISRLGL